MSFTSTPHLIDEWSIENLHELDHYTHGSHFKAMWACSQCGHEWTAMICNRVSKGSNCPECWKKNNRGSGNNQWLGHGELSGLQWSSIQREADRRKIPMSITIENGWNQFLNQNRMCPLTGATLTMKGKRNGKMAGNAVLDRKDSRIGYHIDNIQWIDKRIQAIKRHMLDEDFISICKEVATFHSAKPTPPSFKEWVGQNV